MVFLFIFSFCSVRISIILKTSSPYLDIPWFPASEENQENIAMVDGFVG